MRSNIGANYAGQLYTTLLTVLMVPVYIRFLGAEAYGLVGFFALLQAWFQLLDVGLSPTMGRETSRFSAGVIDILSLRQLLRTLEGLFVGLGLAGMIAVVWGADAITSRWLNLEQLPEVEVRQSLMLMGAVAAMRWVCGLYRGAISGFERLVWLNGFNAAIATARFVLVLPVLHFVGAKPVVFFGYQALVAAVELVGLVLTSYRLLPRVPSGEAVTWRWGALSRVLKFSLGITFTSTVWVVTTQLDKLVLSKLLPLSDYGVFTLAVLAAGGVLVVSNPVNGALVPRLTSLNAAGDDTGLLRVYCNATQMVAVISFSAAAMLACFAWQVLWVWSGDAEIARKAAPILGLYAIGNGVLAVAAFPYYLQVAKGDLKLHLWGNAIFASALVPSVIWSATNYGAFGAGITWVLVNMLNLLLWVPCVHRRFFPKLHVRWLLDILPIAILAIGMAALLSRLVTWEPGRIGAGIELALLAGLVVAAALAGSSWARNELYSMIRIGTKR